jgi:parvulin-like peptidyl-prolyl isomerase
MLIAQALVLGAVLLLSGCGAGGSNGGDGDKSEVAAEVGDVTITEDRLNAFTELLFSMYGLDLAGLEESERNRYKADTLDTMVQIAALEQHFKGKDVTAGADIDGNLAQLKSSIEQTEGLAESLEKKGITDDTLRYFIESQFYFEALQTEETDDAKLPSEADIAAYYAEHEQEFPDEEERRVSHILVGDKDHADEDRLLAEEIRGKIASGAETFEAMAQQHGTDGTRSEGGDLGYATRDSYVPAFSDVAFTLPQGELSGIVESEFGFHVLKVTDIRNARSLDAQRDAIRTALTNENKLQAIVDAYGAVYPNEKYPAPADRAASAEENAGAGASDAEGENGGDDSAG